MQFVRSTRYNKGVLNDHARVYVCVHTIICINEREGLNCMKKSIIELLGAYVSADERARVAQSVLLLNESKSARVAIHDKEGNIARYRDVPAVVMFGALSILLDAYDAHVNGLYKSYTTQNGTIKAVDGFTLEYVYNTVNAYTDKDGARVYQLPLSLLSIARSYFNIDCLSGRGLRKSLLLDSTKEQATSIIEWAQSVLKG